MDATVGQDLKAGIDLYLKQDYPGAEEQLANAVRMQPTWAEGWSYLGFAQYMQKKYSEAAASLEKAVIMDQDNAESRFGLGLVWAAMKRVDAAIACWDETLRIKPGHADAKRSLIGGLVFRAQERLNEKDYDKAEADLERAIKTDRNAAQPVVMLANHFLAQNMTQRAERTVREAIAYLPNDAQLKDLAAKLNVQVDKDVQVAAQDLQMKQQVQKSQEVPCPNCKRPVMEWAAICPHCQMQIKAMPSLFATRNAETKAYAWQDVAYYIVTVLWILVGALPLILLGIAILIAGKKLEESGVHGPNVAGLALLPFYFGGAKVLLGVGLLFQQELCMAIAKWLCIAAIVLNGLSMMMSFGNPIALVLDLLFIGLDAFMIYLLIYMGAD